MAILKVRDEQGNIIEIPAIKGDKGERGDPASATDVKINGTSITQDGVANIPVASDRIKGVVQMEPQQGISAHGTGVIYVNKASESEIDAKASLYKPIVPATIDYAVKKALTDNKGSEWTSEEQAKAKELLGVRNSDVSDVQINETSIITNGIANIPLAAQNIYGVMKIADNWYCGLEIDKNGALKLRTLSPSHIDNRNSYTSGVVHGANFDYVVKAAMCDGKGAEWTLDEQAMARERMGIDREPIVIDIEPNEDVRIIDILEYDGKPLSEYGFTQMWIYAESVEGLTAINNELQIRINNRNITDAIPNLCAPTNFLCNTTTQYWGGYLNTRNGIALSRQTATTYKHWRSNVQIQANMYDLLFQKSINEVYLAGVSADIPKGTKFKVILK